MRKHLMFLLSLALGVSCIILPGTAMAGGSSETCTSGECKFMPATWVPGTTLTTVSGSQSESSSETTKFSVKTTKKVIKTWEKENHRRVAVRTKPNGIKGSSGCMNPEKQGLIKAGDLFWNTDHGVPFLDVWQEGWEICHYREVTIHGKKYLKGTKKNCGNKGIKLLLHSKIEVTYKVVPSLEVKTYKEFWFKIWTKTHSSAHSESGSSSGSSASTEGHYTCPAGYTLTSNNTCRCCPPDVCTPHESEKEKPCGCTPPPKEEEKPCGCTPPPPPPHECEQGSIWSEEKHKCVKNGSTTPPPPVEAPGKNPPDEGEVGSNECYSETTGQPVAPVDGLCPVGSYGSY